MGEAGGGGYRSGRGIEARMGEASVGVIGQVGG